MFASRKSAPVPRVHVFDSRNAAFRDDEVLQENVIVRAVKSRERGAVKRLTRARRLQFGRCEQPGTRGLAAIIALFSWPLNRDLLETSSPSTHATRSAFLGAMTARTAVGAGAT